MKLSAMPASVESSAARGVALRTRSATNAPPSSMTPEPTRREQPRLPRDARRIGGAHALGERLGRQHHQEHVGEERDRVDAVRQRADVVAARPFGEPSRLPRVEEVADEERHRRGRQHAPVDQLGREAEHAPAQRVDQQELDEVVEGQPEEAVDVAAHDPPHAGEHSRALGMMPLVP